MKEFLLKSIDVINHSSTYIVEYKFLSATKILLILWVTISCHSENSDNVSIEVQQTHSAVKKIESNLEVDKMPKEIEKEPKKYNRLKYEKSPYLLQHKNNPIHWYAWGEDAFQAAKNENKPIFLSIGYSTCYWCHVMEKDSFETEEVASYLNENFISIKLDREERPDIDAVYMEAVMIMRQRGGWPMTVFLTPDLKPFFGGTFFYKKKFLEILKRSKETWENNPDRVFSQASSLYDHMSREETPPAMENLDNFVFEKTTRILRSQFDSAFGGFGRAPKFPHSTRISMLLRTYRRSGNREALSMATTTLEMMARGGLFDHVGGGFHRYSTDKEWLTPHFEKMLYDNALLSAAYTEAFLLTNDENFSNVTQRTLDYVVREMTDKHGGFYSAQDAGEVKKEGEFYVWSMDELEKVLTRDELEIAKKTYTASEKGNFEGHIIFNLPYTEPWNSGRSEKSVKLLRKLFKIRDRREYPHLDDKILTAWNGLMITAFANAAQALDRKDYQSSAENAAEFIWKKLYKKGQLYRRYRDGDARFPAYLDDFAFYIQGLIDLYQTSFDKKWLDRAQELQRLQDKFLWDENGLGYFYNQIDSSVIIRKKEFGDGAKPNSNGVSALNLLRLYDLTYNSDYKLRAEQLLGAASSQIVKYPAAYASSLLGLDYYLDSSKEVAVISKTHDLAAKAANELAKSGFYPNVVFASGVDTEIEDNHAIPLLRGKTALSGKTTYYVCENRTCKLPTNSIQTAIEHINKFDNY